MSEETKDERLRRLAADLNEDRKVSHRHVKRVRFTSTKHEEKPAPKALTISEAVAIAKRKASVKKFNTEESGVTRKVISTYANGKMQEVVYHKTTKEGVKRSMTKHEGRRSS